LEISFLALHLTQYPSGIIKFPPRAPCARRSWEIPYERVVESVNLYSGQTRKQGAAIRDWPGRRSTSGRRSPNLQQRHGARLRSLCECPAECCSSRGTNGLVD